MNLSFHLRAAVLPMLFTATFISCQHAVDPAVSEVLDTTAVEEATEPAAEPADTVAEAPKPVAKVSQPKAAAPSRTVSRQVYVTGYNSYGRLWGYVTLQGDKGTGVIHDAEENHYNIHCTRHGDELFAIDQNSRQYVLKISE